MYALLNHIFAVLNHTIDVLYHTFLVGCLCRASIHIHRARAFAHPVLEASGAAITTCKFTGSKDRASREQKSIKKHTFKAV